MFSALPIFHGSFVPSRVLSGTSVHPPGPCPPVSRVPSHRPVVALMAPAGAVGLSLAFACLPPVAVAVAPARHAHGPASAREGQGCRLRGPQRAPLLRSARGLWSGETEAQGAVGPAARSPRRARQPRVSQHRRALSACALPALPATHPWGAESPVPAGSLRHPLCPSRSPLSGPVRAPYAVLLHRRRLPPQAEVLAGGRPEPLMGPWGGGEETVPRENASHPPPFASYTAPSTCPPHPILEIDEFPAGDVERFMLI